jgi:transcriptional regulator with XRE-family HTH domain
MSINLAALTKSLIERRKQLGYTQRQLDDIIGVSDSMVAKWESGMRFPTTKSLERWAPALGFQVRLGRAPVKKRKPH